MSAVSRYLPVLILSTVALAACQREQPAAPPAPARQSAPTPAASPGTMAPTPVDTRLEDVIEQTPTHVIGISYPPSVNQWPGLASALRAYSEDARTELKQAVDGLGGKAPTAPYELSLSFSEIARTAQLVAVSADGSTYTGGAHGNPLIARFVWLIPQQRMLTAQELVPEARDWTAISDYAREQLATRLSERLGSDDGSPAERAESLKNASRMIDGGTKPDPRNFAQFEPVLAPDGRMQALRFVFPPYQVGPYSDGVQTVEIPAAVLLPKVAAEYKGLFVGG